RQQSVKPNKQPHFQQSAVTFHCVAAFCRLALRPKLTADRISLMFERRPTALHNKSVAWLGGALLLIALLVAAYANHFQNGFHFDDAHTIVNNAAIRELQNIPLFFRDGTTFSSLPSNQSYRPLVSTTSSRQAK